ncbi:MAG TPA: DUF2283 domain-containing protein [Planctomycetota bacterium]|nr:DUF2283 domain-containing protein [Planctomycetota bacterium]
MVSVDTLEGTIDQTLWFHYDVGNDVLYLRLIEHRQTEVHGEETPDGVFVMKSLSDDKVVGIEITNWWKRFGKGPLPDSLTQVTQSIEPWISRVAA